MTKDVYSFAEKRLTIRPTVEYFHLDSPILEERKQGLKRFLSALDKVIDFVEEYKHEMAGSEPSTLREIHNHQVKERPDTYILLGQTANFMINNYESQKKQSLPEDAKKLFHHVCFFENAESFIESIPDLIYGSVFGKYPEGRDTLYGAVFGHFPKGPDTRILGPKSALKLEPLSQEDLKYVSDYEEDEGIVYNHTKEKLYDTKKLETLRENIVGRKVGPAEQSFRDTFSMPYVLAPICSILATLLPLYKENKGAAFGAVGLAILTVAGLRYRDITAIPPAKDVTFAEHDAMLKEREASQSTYAPDSSYPGNIKKSSSYTELAAKQREVAI